MAQQKAVFPRDAGLQARILLTLFLLGLLYVVFIAVLLSAGAGLVTVVVVMGGLSLAQLLFSDKLALSAMGAKVVSPQEAPGLHAMIEKLCIQADLPKPRIAVADTDLPNAFACGRSQKSATVCATTGIMRALSPSELEGVMAHELAHVKHRDVLIMTIASFFASLAAIILQFGFFFGGGQSDDDNPSFIVILLVSFVGLRGLLLPDDGPVALPRVRGRPRRRDRHGPAQCARGRAREDLESGEAAAPAATCARPSGSSA